MKNSTMLAAILVKHGAPSTAFKLQEMTRPVPKSNEVLIRSSAFGLNYADVMARQGLYQDAPPLPSVLGYETVGTIEEMGDRVKGFKIGQRVLGFTRFGAYAEFAISDERAVVVLEDNIGDVEALALATQYSTAYYAAAEMVNLQEGDNVLIHAAAGGVGTALVQWAKFKKCNIYGTVGSDVKLEYLKKIGVDVGINYIKDNFESVIKNLCPTGMDVIFDNVGGKNFSKSFNILAPGGRLIGYGAAAMSGKKSILNIARTAIGFGIFSPIKLLMESKALIGVNMLRIADHQPETLKKCLNEVVRLHAEGVFIPTVGGFYSIDQLAEAHEHLSNRSSIGKIGVYWKR